MKYALRFGACVLTAVMLFLGLSHAWAAWMGEDMSVLQLSRWLVFESRRTEALRSRGETVTRNQAIKIAVVEEIFSGRLTLRQSAAYFREANELIASGDRTLMAGYYVPTTDEGVNEQVITWVRSEARRFPGQATEKLIADLERQFQETFGRPYAEPTEEAVPYEPESPAEEASFPTVAG